MHTGRVPDEIREPESNLEARSPDLARAFSEVSRMLDADPDVQRTIDTIVGVAVTTIPGVEHAGVSLVKGGARDVETVAASSQLAERMNKLEHDVGEGPCLDAIADHRIFRSGNLAGERRWKKFGPAAEEIGVSSMLGIRLFTHQRTVGSLDLYSTKPDAFNEESVRVGELLAAHAAVAVLGTQRQSQLRAALDTRDVIATAKGILMGRDGVTEEKAFNTLARTSQHANMKLRDVAAWLVKETETRNAGS